MKKLVLLLLLAGCNSSPETIEERYYAASSAVKATSEIAEQYVDACKTLPPDNGCYKKFPAINKSAKILKDSMKQADKVFVTKDADYYEIAIAIVNNANIALRDIIKE